MVALKCRTNKSSGSAHCKWLLVRLLSGRQVLVSWQQPKRCSTSLWWCGRGGDLCNCMAWLTSAPLPSGTSTECVYFFPSSSCSSASAHPACRLQGNGIIFLPVVVAPALGKKIFFCSHQLIEGCCWPCSLPFGPGLPLHANYDFPLFVFHVHENHFLFTQREQSSYNNLALP